MVRILAVLFALLALAPAAHAAGLASTQRILAREMAHAGTYSGAYVVDLTHDQELYASKPDVPRMPASVEKLYTSATALLLYGADGHLTTQVLATNPPDEAGTVDGDIILRGGGDPTFGSAAATALANKLVAGGLSRVRGRVVGDESAFDAFRGPPSSNFSLSSDVGPLSALSFNHGLTGKRRPYWQSSPAKFAAQAFEKALRHAGVKVSGSAQAGKSQAETTPLSEWESPTLATVTKL